MADDGKPLQPGGDDLFLRAMQAPAPRIYGNGFLLGQSLADATLVIQTNGITSAIVNMSFTSTKTLAEQLKALVDNFERATGHTIMTMADVSEKTGMGKEKH